MRLTNCLANSLNGHDRFRSGCGRSVNSASTLSDARALESGDLRTHGMDGAVSSVSNPGGEWPRTSTERPTGAALTFAYGCGSLQACADGPHEIGGSRDVRTVCRHADMCGYESGRHAHRTWL